jgi:hypothetical protein
MSLNTLVKKQKNNKLAVLLIIILLFAGVAGTIFIHSASQDKNARIERRIKKLESKKDLTCDDVVKSLGSLSANDAKEYDTKIMLLKRQLMCFANSEQFDKAISAGEKLKVLYESQSDTEGINSVNMQIKDIKDTKAQVEKEKSS